MDEHHRISDRTLIGLTIVGVLVLIVMTLILTISMQRSLMVKPKDVLDRLDEIERAHMEYVEEYRTAREAKEQ